MKRSILAILALLAGLFALAGPASATTTPSYPLPVGATSVSNGSVPANNTGVVGQSDFSRSNSSTVYVSLDQIDTTAPVLATLVYVDNNAPLWYGGSAAPSAAALAATGGTYSFGVSLSNSASHTLTVKYIQHTPGGGVGINTLYDVNPSLTSPMSGTVLGTSGYPGTTPCQIGLGGYNLSSTTTYLRPYVQSVSTTNPVSVAIYSQSTAGVWVYIGTDNYAAFSSPGFTGDGSVIPRGINGNYRVIFSYSGGTTCQSRDYLGEFSNAY